MNIKHSIGLNLSADAIPGRLHMVQGDSNSRTIVATLWDGAQLYSIPAGAAIMVRFRKPDGTGGLYDSTESGNKVSYAGSIVTAPVATQMLAVAGDVFAEIDIFGSGSGTAAERLATFRFVVEVAPCVLPDAQITSSDYYNVLASDIADAKTAAAKAQKSATAAAKSAASAATSVEGAVKYNVAQALTPVQRVQAQKNIGVTWACNPNLLDNPDYAVNQRGITNLPAEAGYYADRWWKYGGATTGTVSRGNVHLISDGTATCGWSQIVEADRLIAGMTYTLSFLIKPVSIDVLTNIRLSYGNNRNDNSGTSNLPADTPLNAWTVFSYTFTLPESSDGFYNFRARALAVPCEFEIGPGKLELGAQQTLAHQDSSGAWVLNEIPDYAEQLRRCQRYLYVQRGIMLVCGVITGAKKTMNVAVPVPVPMRSLPSLEGVPSVSGVRTIQGTNMAAEITGGNVIASTSLDTAIAIALSTETFNTAEYINNTPIMCYISDVTLSAEL